MSTPSPIVKAYKTLLTKGRLQTNPAQSALVVELGSLQQSLLQRSSWTRYDGSRYHNGIYIYGGVGTGKSRIADLFASTLPKSVTCRRVHFYEFMVDVHQRLHRARQQDTFAGDPLVSIGQVMRSESSILCFDEFQVSDIADAMILKRLFGSFWNSGGMIVSTSNRHPTELYKNGLNRPLFVPFIQELQNRCLVWKMEGEHDYRTTSGESGTLPVYFTDSSAFQEAMLEAAGGLQLEQVHLDVVMNRSITVYATNPTLSQPSGNNLRSKSLVYSPFQKLCEASLGTSDYHSLCNFAHTIFVSGLRQFQPHQLDFLRRFINLVDIAYESRTRIVCLSEVPMTELFSKVGIAPELLRPTSLDLQLPALSEVNLSVRGKGGSSSSMMSTFLGDMEWSATGLMQASLASGGAGENDVRFAVGRAISRLSEMQSAQYGIMDD